MEKTLAIHLAEQREQIAQQVEGMAIMLRDSVDVPTQLILIKLHQAILEEIRNSK